MQEHKDAKLIILCADTPRGKIQHMVDKVAYNLDIPWLALGPYGHSKAFLGPLFLPKQTKSYSEIFSEADVIEDDRIIEINNNFKASIIAPFNGLVAKMATVEVLKFLTGYAPVSIINTRLIVNTDTWLIEERKY